MSYCIYFMVGFNLNIFVNLIENNNKNYYYFFVRMKSIQRPHEQELGEYFPTLYRSIDILISTS